MNGRKAKAYRKLVKQTNTEYIGTEKIVKVGSNVPWMWRFISTKEKDYINYGTKEKPNFMEKTKTIKLVPNCSKAQVKLLKRIDL